jgi:hypothetical protein
MGFPDVVEYEFPEAKPGGGVQLGERLIKEDCARLGQQNPHQGNPGPLSSREGSRIPVFETRQPGVVQGAGDSGGAFAFGSDFGRETKSKILSHTQMGKEEVILEKDAEPTELRWEVRNFGVVDEDRAGSFECRGEGATQEGEQARFSRSAFPHHGQDFAGWDYAGKRAQELSSVQSKRDVVEMQSGGIH